MQEAVSSVEKNVSSNVNKAWAEVSNKVSETVSNKVSETVSHKVSESVNESVQNKIKSSWSAVVGDNPTATVTHSPEETQKWIEHHSRKFAREIRREEIRAESRLNNLIIYGAPEDNKLNGKEKHENDKKMVDELLQTLEVDHKPENLYRIGDHRDNKDEEKDGKKQRILKVVFKSNEAVKNIMEMANKLAHAPENLKRLSLEYDMSFEERQILKKKLDEAREKN